MQLAPPKNVTSGETGENLHIIRPLLDIACHGKRTCTYVEVGELCGLSLSLAVTFPRLTRAVQIGYRDLQERGCRDLAQKSLQPSESTTEQAEWRGHYRNSISVPKSLKCGEKGSCGYNIANATRERLRCVRSSRAAQEVHHLTADAALQDGALEQILGDERIDVLLLSKRRGGNDKATIAEGAKDLRRMFESLAKHVSVGGVVLFDEYLTSVEVARAVEGNQEYHMFRTGQSAFRGGGIYGAACTTAFHCLGPVANWAHATDGGNPYRRADGYDPVQPKIDKYNPTFLMVRLAASGYANATTHVRGEHARHKAVQPSSLRRLQEAVRSPVSSSSSSSSAPSLTTKNFAFDGEREGPVAAYNVTATSATKFCDIQPPAKACTANQMDVSEGVAWLVQHQTASTSCQKPKNLLMGRERTNVIGMGSRFQTHIACLTEAVQRGLVWVPPPCNAHQHDCGLLQPWSNCNISHVTQQTRKCYRYRSAAVPDRFKSNGLMWWRAVATAFLIRPGAALERALASHKQAIGWHPPALGIHVRHGDKTHGLWRERPNIPLSTYLKRVPNVASFSGVFLATDDPDMFMMAPKLHPDVKFFRPPDAKKFRSKKQRDHQSVARTMDALVEILLLASSEMTVLTYSSNFGQLVFYLGVARKQRCPNAILVDTVHDTEGVLEYACSGAPSNGGASCCPTLAATSFNGTHVFSGKGSNKPAFIFQHGRWRYPARTASGLHLSQTLFPEVRVGKLAQ